MYPKFSRHMFLHSWSMLHALSNDPDRGTQIYGAESIPNCPDCSTFNRGGGPESVIGFAQI